MQDNRPQSQTTTGFSNGSQRALFVAIIVMGLMIFVGIGVIAYVSISRHFHSKVSDKAVVATQDIKDKDAESTYGSVLMVPRQGLEVVHSAVGMPDGKLAIVMFPGFSASSSGKEPTKKDPNNTADGGRILLWDPVTGHITQEMRISSVQPQLHP